MFPKLLKWHSEKWRGMQLHIEARPLVKCLLQIEVPHAREADWRSEAPAHESRHLPMTQSAGHHVAATIDAQMALRNILGLHESEEDQSAPSYKELCSQ